jgi:hypothetical protein
VNRFVSAAFCVVLILFLSAVSVYYAFELMFHKWYVQILLSLFFSLTFGIIYILLIQTFSKQPLAQKSRYRLNASNILRGGFIMFIGFLISKPIEILILTLPISEEIAVYKQGLSTSFEKQTIALYATDINKLKTRQAYNEKIKNSLPPDEVLVIDNQLREIKTKQQEEIEKADDRIVHSAFFLQRIKFAINRHPISWFICVCIIFLFSVPAILVYTVSSDNDYYVGKRAKEREIVLDHYTDFTLRYTKVFADSYQLKNIFFYEKYLDPPFRTQRIQPPACQTETDFFTLFIGNGLPEKLL